MKWVDDPLDSSDYTKRLEQWKLQHMSDAGAYERGQWEEWERRDRDRGDVDRKKAMEAARHQQIMVAHVQAAAAQQAQAAEVARVRRQRLAELAMQALLIGYGQGGAAAVQLAADIIAGKAYAMADAMLRAEAKL